MTRFERAKFENEVVNAVRNVILDYSTNDEEYKDRAFEVLQLVLENFCFKAWLQDEIEKGWE